MHTSGPIAPGGTIGILGGGQLARMLAMAAARYGLDAHVYAPETDSPAFAVAARHTLAAYDDETALAAFAGSVDVVTYEFENVPARTAEIVARHAPLRPGAHALAVTQDRLVEKTFIADAGLPVAPFAAVDDAAGLRQALAKIGTPAILKTRRLGYDGKGQVRIRTADEAASALAAIGHAPAILEGVVKFALELSVVAARAADGSFAAFDVCENEHANHILAATHVPAAISAQTADAALGLARTLADALDYVGVLAVELFLVREGGTERLVVNEIAPRVHNSGHWTIEGAQTSQFEQHVRAICGWPLGATRRTGAIRMANLIGADAHGWAELAAEPDAHLHLYGKREARPGRKMGHVTYVTPPQA